MSIDPIALAFAVSTFVSAPVHTPNVVELAQNFEHSEGFSFSDISVYKRPAVTVGGEFDALAGDNVFSAELEISLCTKEDIEIRPKYKFYLVADGVDDKKYLEGLFEHMHTESRPYVKIMNEHSSLMERSGPEFGEFFVGLMDDVKPILDQLTRSYEPFKQSSVTPKISIGPLSAHPAVKPQ
jgi:hypothetical protein